MLLFLLYRGENKGLENVDGPSPVDGDLGN